jgi:hypothetical protein
MPVFWRPAKIVASVIITAAAKPAKPGQYQPTGSGRPDKSAKAAQATQATPVAPKAVLRIIAKVSDEMAILTSMM